MLVREKENDSVGLLAITEVWGEGEETSWEAVYSPTEKDLENQDQTIVNLSLYEKQNNRTWNMEWIGKRKYRLIYIVMPQEASVITLQIIRLSLSKSLSERLSFPGKKLMRQLPTSNH